MDSANMERYAKEIANHYTKNSNQRDRVAAVIVSPDSSAHIRTYIRPSWAFKWIERELLECSKGSIALVQTDIERVWNFDGEFVGGD
jgi:hypothetical protein